jgi:ADP-ribosylglycohydrolase
MSDRAAFLKCTKEFMSIQTAESLLFGLALGDALGWPVEFSNLTAIKQQYGATGIQEPPDPAEYTDDTQMTIALAEGLLDAGLNAPVDEIMDAVGARFVTWLELQSDPRFRRAPGNACLAGMERYRETVNWRESGNPQSKGCGSAMRVAPLGYLYQHDPERLREIAIASSLITHGHPAALAASVGAAYAVKLALDGVHPEEMPRRIAAFTDGMSDDFTHALHRIGHVAGWINEEHGLAHLGEGWIAEEAVALALFCAIRYPDDYTNGVRRGANLTGDSDSVASIAGGILGARLGLGAIPADWQARCENSDYIKDVAARMTAARAAAKLDRPGAKSE